MTRFIALFSVLLPVALSAMHAPIRSDAHGTYLYSEKLEKKYYLGLHKSNLIAEKKTPDRKYREADVKVPNDFYMPSKWPLPQGLPYDQGSCGSCVVNSINGQVTYALSIRGKLPATRSPLSRGQVMECNPTAGQCSGDWAENVGGWVGKRGHLLSELDYNYRPVDGSCRGITGTEYGEIPPGRVVDNSAKSIGTMLVLGIPPSTTVGADGSWMNASASKVYTACTNQGTNHEVLIVGIHATGAARGSDGFINFAAAKPGDISLDILNSWGDWCDHGVIHTLMYSTSGRRCNNVTEEVYAFDWAPASEPVDGGWSAWSSCVDGKQIRACTNPVPYGGGKDCVGPATQVCTVPVPPSPSGDHTLLYVVGGLIVAAFVGGFLAGRASKS
jgi:hypothetical protein